MSSNASDIAKLREMFPETPLSTLTTALALADNSLENACDLLISIRGDISGSTGPHSDEEQPAGPPVPPVPLFHPPEASSVDIPVPLENVASTENVIRATMPPASESEDEGIVFGRHRISSAKTTPPQPPLKYWVRIGEDVLMRTHLELLNLRLTSLRVRSITVLRGDAQAVPRSEANNLLQIHPGRYADDSVPPTPKRRRIFCDGLTPNRRKAVDLGVGVWAHFCEIDDCDYMWRLMVSAHLNSHRFGRQFELCLATVASGSFYSVFKNYEKGAAYPVKACCVVAPCSLDRNEIRDIGCGFMSTTKARPSCYFRVHSDATSGLHWPWLKVTTMTDDLTHSEADHILHSVLRLTHEKAMMQLAKKHGDTPRRRGYVTESGSGDDDWLFSGAGSGAPTALFLRGSVVTTPTRTPTRAVPAHPYQLFHLTGAMWHSVPPW